MDFDSSLFPLTTERDTLALAESYRKQLLLDEPVTHDVSQVIAHDVTSLIEHLQLAWSFRAPILFVNLVLWLADVLSCRNVSWENLDRTLARLKGVIQNQSDSSDEKGTFLLRTITQAQESLRQRRTPESLSQNPSTTDTPMSQYLSAILSGKFFAALEVLRIFISSGNTLELLFREVLVPCHCRVGELWQQARIDVADEHLAMATSRRAIDIALQHFPFTHREPRGLVIIACAPGELHDLPATMLARRWEHQGWSVQFLGASTPLNAILSAAWKLRPQVLALSATMTRSLKPLREICLRLETVPDLRETRILVGGAAFRGLETLEGQFGRAEIVTADAEIHL